MNRDETPDQYTARLLAQVGDDEPWKVITTTARRLRELIAGRTAEELSRKPDPSKWSVVEILAHLADAEVVAGWRFRSILAWDGVPLQPFDQDTWAATFRYAEADPFDSVMLFEVNRRSLLTLLRRVDRTLYANHGMHAERGQETIEHLVRLYAGHDLNHLRQLEAQIAQLPAPDFQPAPARDAIDVAEANLDVRVGMIVAAEAVAGSRKLAALRVDFGDHHRTIVAGIVQERFALEPLIGRQALFVVNLPPRPMAGVTSEGMLFDLGFADGLKPALAVPEFPVPNGTRAG
jgi:methionine--tRNA ligase beta chain